MTRRLKIIKNNREYPIWVVKPTDFTYELGPEIDPLEVLRDPAFSLYCIDPENEAVLFVQCSDQSGVDRAPFYYQAQAEQAVGLVSMPFEVFHRIAERIPEPPKGLILVHSVGRCGSTLLSKALAAVPEVHSLSEPDDLTQMISLRKADGSSDAWLSKLIASSTKWRCKPRIGRKPDYVAIKTRSEVLALADLIAPVFPNSKHLFLYRDAVSWSRSNFRGFPPDRDFYDAELNRQFEDRWSDTIPLVREYRRDEAPMNPVQVRLFSWITCMEAYLKLKSAGLDICAARYEDILRNPLNVIEQLFNFCGIEISDWQPIREVLGRDSQAGTMYDREERRKLTYEISEDAVEDIKNLVATRPLLGTSDVVLPGTIRLYDSTPRSSEPTH